MARRIILGMTANDLLQITLAMRDADLPTDEKLAVLDAAATVIRDSAETADEAVASGSRVPLAVVFPIKRPGDHCIP